ncbi:MAG: T9SS type A sorting domain-containing protein [bacterium]
MKRILLIFSICLFSTLPSIAQGPPPGITPVYFCDDDSDGFYTFDLAFVLSEYFNLGPDFDLSVHLTANDAFNDVNELTGLYTNTSNPETLWVRIFDVVAGELASVPGQLELNVIDCSQDADSDSIASSIEDLDSDNNLGDHDTDNDGIPNFMDDDDDEDGILTINEDYNNNGDPTDDDTNMNGIPDYLDDEATLSISNLSNDYFKVYPNPADGLVQLSFPNNFDSESIVEIIDMYGNVITKFSTKHSVNILLVDVSAFANGMYLVSLQTNERSITKKMIVAH